MREHFTQQEQERKSWRETGEKDFEKFYLKDFLQQLKYGNGFLRRQAIHYLGLVGPGAKSVVPELRKLLKDPDEDTRRMAAEAIKQIETEVVTSNEK